MDLLKIIVWTQKREEFLNVQPLVERSAYGPIIEVEAIDIYDRSRLGLGKWVQKIRGQSYRLPNRLSPGSRNTSLDTTRVRGDATLFLRGNGVVTKALARLRRI